MKTKKTIKKVNSGNKNISVKTLACHCGCEGKPISAAGNGYIGRYL